MIAAAMPTASTTADDVKRVVRDYIAEHFPRSEGGTVTIDNGRGGAEMLCVFLPVPALDHAADFPRR